MIKTSVSLIALVVGACLAFMAHELALFGLDTRDHSRCFVTCVRELLENALDATAPIQGPSHVSDSPEGCRQIIIHTTEDLDGSGVVIVRIADDGRGLSDEAITRVCSLFASSKGSSGATAGVFGVGLKAVLHWAQQSGPLDQCFRIRTTTVDSPHWSEVRIKAAASQSSVSPAASSQLIDCVRKPKRPPGAALCGTVVDTMLRCGDDPGVLLDALFDTLPALMTPVPLRIFHKVATRAEPTPQHRTIDVSPTPLGSIYLSDPRHETPQPPPIMEGVRNVLKERALAALATPVPGTSPTAASDYPWLLGFGEGVSVLSSESFVHATLLLVASQQDSSANPHVVTAPNGSVPLCLLQSTLLFVNNKRIGEEGLSNQCASAAAFREVRWRAHGGKLHPSHAEVTFESPSVRVLWIAIHVRNSAGELGVYADVRYGNLGKTLLAPSQTLSKGIGLAVEAALERSVAELVGQGAPLAKRDRQREEERRLAAGIAKSIAAVVNRSRDEELRRECFDTLRLDADGAGDAVPCAQLEPVLLDHLLRDWGDLFAERPPRDQGADTADMGSPRRRGRTGGAGRARGGGRRGSSRSNKRTRDRSASGGTSEQGEDDEPLVAQTGDANAAFSDHDHDEAFWQMSEVF